MPPVRITRTRPSTTCGPCRRRKVKCDRRKPACSQCAKTSVVCSYDTQSSSSSFSAQQQHHHHHHHQHPQPTTAPSLSEASLLPLGDSLSAEWPLQWDLDSSPFVSAAHDFSALLYQDDVVLPSSALGEQTANLESPPSAKVCQVNRPQSTSRQRRGPHWALVGEKDSNDTLLRQSQQRRVKLTFDANRWSRICDILQHLPPKPVCDELLQCFLCSVQPLVCIVHVPTLLKDHDAFWARHSQQSRAVPTAETAMREASFFCLLWAVLFAGAVAKTCALSSSSSPPVAPVALKARFREIYAATSQKALPTLNGLAALLLVHECDIEVDELLDTPSLVSQAFITARMLGLHREDAIASRGPVEAEMCRRIWYHILYLDSFASVAAGSPISANGDHYDTRMPLAISDVGLESAHMISQQDAERMDEASESLPPDSLPVSSSNMILNVSRFECFGLSRSIVQRCYYDPHPPSLDDLQSLGARLECLSNKLDARFDKLKTRGMPEDGQISTQLLLASNAEYPSTHNDDPNEETVFNAYARICMNLLRSYVAVQFAAYVASSDYSLVRQALGEANSSFNLVQQCISLLTSYQRLATLPALYPYRWYQPHRAQPLQACVLLLRHMEQHPACAEYQQSQYLVGEMLDIFLHPDGSARVHCPGGPRSWADLRKRFLDLQNKTKIDITE